MRMWVTTIRAIDPKTGQLKTWGGPNVPGYTHQEAVQYCEENGLGYCRVDGQLIMEIPADEETMTPDWSRAIDYDNLN